MDLFANLSLGLSRTLTWQNILFCFVGVLLGKVIRLILVQAGFILVTSFLIIFEARLIQPGKWMRNAVIGSGFSARVYYALVRLLNVMLPAGILG